MAIEFARMSIIKRSEMRNAIQVAAYRAREKLIDHRTDQVYDYSKKSDLVFQTILLPENADVIFSNREKLWNLAELAETRKDAQVAKEIMLALPKELPLDHLIELAERFAYDQFVQHGLAADIAIHHHDENPHAHIQVTTRRIIGKEFDRYKARDLNPSFAFGKIAGQDHWNKIWRVAQNHYFQEKGIDLIVDPNRLIPTIHEGRNRNPNTELIKINQERKLEAREITLIDPINIINQLSLTHTIFSHQDVAKLLHKTLDKTDDFKHLLIKVINHPSLIKLGLAEDGFERYITANAFKKEIKLEQDCIQLIKLHQHFVPEKLINNTLAKFQLNQGQADACRHVLSNGSLKVIVGRAGTGKTYTMKAVNSAFQECGYQTMGLALAGVAADGLKREADINSRTIASFKKLITQQPKYLTKKHVLIVDEASMIDLHDMAFIIKNIKRSGSKLIVLGDHGQAESIGAGSPFPTLLHSCGYIELNEIRRQKTEWMQKATLNFANGKTRLALKQYQQHGYLHFDNDEESAKEHLINDWFKHFKKQNIAHNIITAHQNKTITELNILARTKLIEQGYIEKGKSVFASKSIIHLCVNDRIIFLKNDSQLKVKNGHFATVTAINDNIITVQLDNGRFVTIDNNTFRQFDYGYAATIHKLQGVTKVNTFVYVDGWGWNRNLTYVAMSRHKHACHLYASKEIHKSENKLFHQLSRYGIKDAIVDFPLRFAIEAKLKHQTVFGQLFKKLNINADKIKDYWQWLFSYQHKKQIKNHKLDLYEIIKKRNKTKIVATYIDIDKQIKSIQQQIIQLGKNNFNATAKKLGVNKQLYNLYEQRNKLAFTIINQKENLEPAITRNNINITILEQQAFRHRVRIDKEIQSKKAKPSLAYQQKQESKFYDYQQVNHALMNRAEEFYSSHLGKPSIRNITDLRFGNKGSFAVQIGGNYKGLWKSFESDDRGNPIQFLLNPHHGLGMEFKQALAYGAEWAGLTDTQVCKNFVIEKSVAEISKEKKEQEREIKKRINTARYLASLSIPIKGTLAEKYLKVHRKIPVDINSPDLRFLPGNEKYPEPKLLAISRNEKSEITAVQTIALDKDTANKNKTTKQNKIVNGVRYHFLIHKGSSDKVIFAEGVETGLSVAYAMPEANIYAVCGSPALMKNIDYLLKHHKTDKLIIAADNDQKGSDSMRLLKDTFNYYEDKGIETYVIKPDKEDKSLKIDWNNVLINKGAESVKSSFIKKLKSKYYFNSNKIDVDKILINDSKLNKNHLNIECLFEKKEISNTKTIDIDFER